VLTALNLWAPIRVSQCQLICFQAAQFQERVDYTTDNKMGVKPASEVCTSYAYRTQQTMSNA
jgi:hypothetical protein